MENNGKKLRHHFVLVHGLCHGAWCWYKVATVLESAGHGVTALDLPGCGASAVRAEEVRSFEEYSRPLLRAVAAAPPGEKVVLVGHSFGGHNLALAMEAHPEKVAVAIFVSAPMPVAGRPMSAILEQHLQGDSAPHSFLDCTFGIVETGSEDPAETFLVGPEWMSQRMYQLSPPEDLTLARMLARPAQMFLRDEAMTGEKVLTEGRYGAVTRVFVVAEEDKTWPAEEQRRVAASCGPGVEVRAIGGVDHMPMFSKPEELAQVIMEVAEKYS
ncbi:hypothetical protein GQ55_5G027500 [Panicum hallii var. hallii]|uniref:AB hydrolase-1 domain-containing protein n=1 Tax=Panicum hallii var. hallii TaxID=1504633 RepID=A0A2T7DC09_9POAL|nr:hypothetical protein GQ55_5G027500 [Panicum hallii var. hallii]